MNIPNQEAETSSDQACWNCNQGSGLIKSSPSSWKLHWDVLVDAVIDQILIMIVMITITTETISHQFQLVYSSVNIVWTI